MVVLGEWVFLMSEVPLLAVAIQHITNGELALLCMVVEFRLRSVVGVECGRGDSD